MATVMLPNRIKLLRMRRMWSQKELAARLGISQAALCDIEQGHRKPRLDTALALERVLGERLAAIFVPMEYSPDCEQLVPNGPEGRDLGQGTASAAEVAPEDAAGPEKP